MPNCDSRSVIVRKCEKNEYTLLYIHYGHTHTHTSFNLPTSMCTHPIYMLNLCDIYVTGGLAGLNVSQQNKHS